MVRYEQPSEIDSAFSSVYSDGASSLHSDFSSFVESQASPPPVRKGRSRRKMEAAGNPQKLKHSSTMQESRIDSQPVQRMMRSQSDKSGAAAKLSAAEESKCFELFKSLGGQKSGGLGVKKLVGMMEASFKESQLYVQGAEIREFAELLMKYAQQNGKGGDGSARSITYKQFRLIYKINIRNDTGGSDTHKRSSMMNLVN